MPLRRFRYDASHDILTCPKGRILRSGRPITHGRFFYSKAKECARCPLKADCLSKGRVNKAVVVGTLEIDDGDRQIGLNLHIGEAAPHGARQPVPAMSS